MILADKITELRKRSGWSQEELAGRLGAEGICTRAGLHCSPLAHRSAGTLPDGAVRFSFSWFNTRQEAEAAALTVKKVLKNAEA